jgi:pimeloyl-ACP methyl ester carboxylesterase
MASNTSVTGSGKVDARDGPTPETLVKGREHIYFSFFWNDLAADKNRSIPKADRKAYLASYSRPGRMQASWKYFASWPQTAKDFAQMSKTQLTMPVLSIGGDKSLGEVLGAQMKLVATDVTVVMVKNSGHWILEEQPGQTTEALLKFL